MSKLEFKESDFPISQRDELTSAAASYLANRRLAEMLASAPVVYLNEIKEGETINYTNNPNTIWGAACTHKARLVQLEELPKAECKHTPHLNLSNLKYDDSIKACEHKLVTNCIHCGIELKAEWSAK